MHQKLLKSAHYIELGSYQYWPVLVPRGIRLYTYEQIPVSLKDNPYITDGYRAYLPSRLCIKRYSPAASVGARRRLLVTSTLFVWCPCCFPRFLRACHFLAVPSFSSFFNPSPLSLPSLFPRGDT